MLNYFNFKEFNGQFLLTNDFGRYLFINPDEFKELLLTSKVSNEAVQNILIKNEFIYESSSVAFIDENKQNLIYAKNYLFESTQLHIFVVTNACNMHCVYCQAQNGNCNPNGFMTIETAKKAVDIALQSPSKILQFEFQGGEPLLNFDVIKYIVKYSQEKANDKDIHYSIVTNLTLITEEMMDFFQNNEIGISTSLDGDKYSHEANRPYKNGYSTYCDVIKAIKELNSRNMYVGALLTTTRTSLSRYKEIIDAYVDLGFNSISIRALTPLGCAKNSWADIGYSSKEFLDFYEKCLDYILQINMDGYRLTEGLAAIFLKKIIEGISMNYMELRSPCGASLGQVAYYYDGNIYTCDEGRMLAEMGNDAFHLGNVSKSNYDSIIESKICHSACLASITESLPSCSDCAYQPYCGVCPVVNYALYNDVFERTPRNYRCAIYGGMLDIIFTKLQEDDYDIRQIFRSWLL